MVCIHFGNKLRFPEHTSTVSLNGETMIGSIKSIRSLIADGLMVRQIEDLLVPVNFEVAIAHLLVLKGDS